MNKHTPQFIFTLSLIALFACSPEKKIEDRIEEQVTVSSQKIVPASEMVPIPEGDFIMGSNEGAYDEKPKRRVFVDSFLIDTYAVTNEEYRLFIKETGRPLPERWMTGYDRNTARHPVIYVNFEDASSYCTWVGKRLSTEEEWEKAARGTDGGKYPWGNTFDKTKANTGLTAKTGPMDVASYEAGKSPYNIFNMAGNVWEWTTTPGQTEKRRITKGGSWGLSHRFSRTFSRVDYAIADRANNLGFRCVKDASSLSLP